MGMRFRKSIKIAPGVKVNVGKKSAGVSVGGKYGGVSVNSKSGTRVRTSVPGTGVSYTQKVGGTTKKAVYKNDRDYDEDLELEEYEADDDEPVQRTDLEWAKADTERLELNLNVMKWLLPVLCIMLLVLAMIYPVCYLFIIAFCAGFTAWRKKAIREMAIAKYRANCLQYGRPLNDPPSDADISPYLIRDTYADRKGRTRKKKPFYLQWWFIALFVFSLLCTLISMT